MESYKPWERCFLRLQTNNFNKPYLVHGAKEYTFGQFISDLNQKKHYSSSLYVANNDPYEIFLAIIHSLVYGYSIEVLDGDFSKIELEKLKVDQKEIFSLKKIEEPFIIRDFDSLLNKINQNKEWYLTLYTSGTTGRPKKVSHTLKTLTRNVKLHNRFKNDIWAFSYNPTHIAGLQVFFQAFLNQNTIVYTFNEQPKNMPNLIEKYKITHISATSTFYRNLLPYLKEKKFDSVIRATFGGERYDVNLESFIKSSFPNAKIRNIYASTEAGSLFVAHGDIFEIREEIQKFVKVSEDKELLIHSSLLDKSKLISPKRDWFNTGDLVEVLDPYHFRFTSRISEMINVGGYKVNPIEIENILMKVPGVIDILVKSRENNVTGQIIVADIVKDESFDDKEFKKIIKKFASTHLQEWKVPRIIKFVKSLPRTRTGKKDRK